MSSLTRTIKRGIMFKDMNAKQKKLRRAERKNARENPQAEAERLANIVSHIVSHILRREV